YGELALKGKNRGRFEHTLLRNLQATVADLEGVHVRQRHGVLVLRSAAPQEVLIERAQTVLGISVVHPATMVKPDPKAIEAAALQVLDPYAERAATTFAFRPRRRWKGFPLRSQQIAIDVGDRIRTELGLGVDLTTPDVELGIEVYRHEALLSTEKLPGQGG